MWIRVERAISDLDKADVVIGFCGCPCAPVAVSSYMGEGGCTVWIDEESRFYAVDDEGIVFLAQGIRDTMEILLNYGRVKKPPEGIPAAGCWHESAE